MVVEMHPEDLNEESVARFMQEYVQALGGTAENIPDMLRFCDENGLPAQISSPADEPHPLALMYWQEALERQCWLQGNRRQTAPAQRMADFVNRRLSYDLPATSYAPGLLSSPLHFWLPRFLSDRLARGFLQFGRSSHGFLTNEAVMIGMESRTSSPVRIVRHPETLQHVTVNGLFPCGEGAGYAGGIVSAAIDGERCAEAAAAYLSAIH